MLRSGINPKGVGGLIFTIGVVLIVLIGVPQSRYFFLGAVIVGGAVGWAMHEYHKRRAYSDDDLPPRITPD
jgi:hypothetical protein